MMQITLVLLLDFLYIKYSNYSLFPLCTHINFLLFQILKNNFNSINIFYTFYCFCDIHNCLRTLLFGCKFLNIPVSLKGYISKCTKHIQIPLLSFIPDKIDLSLSPDKRYIGCLHSLGNFLTQLCPKTQNINRLKINLGK